MHFNFRVAPEVKLCKPSGCSTRTQPCLLAELKNKEKRLIGGRNLGKEIYKSIFNYRCIVWLFCMAS